MPYPMKGIANAILNRAAQDGQKLDHLQLQKLMYYANGYYLAAHDEPLIDHTFEAWEYGPVVPELYREFRSIGRKKISRPATEFDWEENSYVPVPIPTKSSKVDHVIDFVFRTYGNYDGLRLSDMTHAPDSPWDITRKKNPGIKDADIPNELLKTHFRKFIKTKK